MYNPQYSLYSILNQRSLLQLFCEISINPCNNLHKTQQFTQISGSIPSFFFSYFSLHTSYKSGCMKRFSAKSLFFVLRAPFFITPYIKAMKISYTSSYCNFTFVRNKRFLHASARNVCSEAPPGGAADPDRGPAY